MRMGYRFLVVVPILVVCLSVWAGAAAEAVITPVFTDFDNGLDGWTIEGDGILSWNASGGNPGGCFQATDPAEGVRSYAIAPAKFLGDWSYLNEVGQLLFDQLIIVGTTGEGVKVEISGPGGTAKCCLSESYGPFPDCWTNFVIPLQEDAWVMLSGNWSSVLQEVTRLSIETEFISGTETTALDNVRLEIPGAIIADNFDDNIRNPVLWSSSASEGVTVEEVNQRLEFTYSPTASGSQFGAIYRSTWGIRGDFDIQADFELLTWPPGNGVRIGIIPTWWSLQRSSLGPELTTPSEIYCLDSSFEHGGGLVTSDQHGSLRIIRTGSFVSGYYLNNGEWQLIWSYDYGSDGLLDVPWFDLSTWSHDYAFADQPVRFAFDNFIVRKGEILWNQPLTCTVGGAKSYADNSPIFIDSAIVTADQSLEPDSIFLEAPDRSCGIRVVTNESLQIGQNVRLSGIIRRIDGERLIDSVDLINITQGTAIQPVGATSRTIGNDRTETLNYSGIDTTGLLVRMCGKVTAVISSQRVVYVDDGGSYQDGLGPFIGIRVNIPEGADIPDKGNQVVITGISRVEMHILTDWGEVNGDWKPTGTVVYVPSLTPGN